MMRPDNNPSLFERMSVDDKLKVLDIKNYNEVVYKSLKRNLDVNTDEMNLSLFDCLNIHSYVICRSGEVNRTTPFNEITKLFKFQKQPDVIEFFFNTDYSYKGAVINDKNKYYSVCKYGIFNVLGIQDTQRNRIDILKLIKQLRTRQITKNKGHKIVIHKEVY